jgi:hypothetical protein
MKIKRFFKHLCGLWRTHLRGESITAGNIKINANFLKGGFVRLSNSCGFYKQCRLIEVSASNPPFKNLRLSLVRCQQLSNYIEALNFNKMKKYFTILFLTLALKSSGQVTLENIYLNSISVPSFLMFAQLDSVTYKYILFDHLNSQFTIYNLDHSIYLNVLIPITYVAGSSQYQIAYVTKSLFDCDTSNIEYALSFLGNGGPTSYPKHFYVYRTDGTQLTDIDSCCFMNYSDGWKYGPLYNRPIVRTPVGSKLILRCLDGGTRVYSVCGNLPSSCDDDLSLLVEGSPERHILGNAFPNPTHNQITIPFSLPDNEKNGIIKIYDINGMEIKTFRVDRNFNSIVLSTSELSSGTYYYQLQTSKGKETKKVIRIE